MLSVGLKKPVINWVTGWQRNYDCHDSRLFFSGIVSGLYQWGPMSRSWSQYWATLTGVYFSFASWGLARHECFGVSSGSLQTWSRRISRSTNYLVILSKTSWVGADTTFVAAWVPNLSISEYLERIQRSLNKNLLLDNGSKLLLVEVLIVW